MTGENLLRLLELRLDNVVFRHGLRRQPRPQARQMVGHGHFAVNGRATNIPSLPGCKPGDRIEVRERTASREPFKQAKETLRVAPGAGLAERRRRRSSPGPCSPLPRRDQMPLDLNEQLVVEYYSR